MTISTKKKHAGRLRRHNRIRKKLQAAGANDVTITNIRGFGYRLEVEGPETHAFRSSNAS